MTVARLFGAEQHRLLAASGVVPLLPRDAQLEEMGAGVQTTTRGTDRLAVGVDVRWAPGGGATAVEVCTIARDHILGSIPHDERAAVGDGTLVAVYLEREARSGLALRTLELADGDAERLPQPLDGVLVERRAALPGARTAQMLLDGRRLAAASMRYGDRCATWADVADHGIGVVVYAPSDGVPELVTAR